MKKRILSFLLAVCMVLSIAPMPAYAEDVPIYDCGEEHTHTDTCLAAPNVQPVTEDVPEEQPQEEPQGCTCETACAAGAMNGECAICGAEGTTVEGCGKYVAPVVCTCETACAAGAMNAECSVCGAADAKLENCTKYQAPASYTVTFNVGEHGTAPESQTVTEGSAVTKPADPTAEGFTFGGWYADEAYTTEYDFSAAVTANTTLYAKWTEDTSDNDSNSTYEIDTAEKLLQFSSGESGLNAVLTADITFPTGNTLTISEGATLTVPEGKTLSVPGDIVNNGTFIVNGTLVLSATMYKGAVMGLGITGTGGIKFGAAHIGTDGDCITHNWGARIKQKDTTQHYTMGCRTCNIDDEATIEPCEYDDACDENCNVCRIVRTIEHQYDANGFCTVCRYSDSAAEDSDGDGYVEIDSAGKLYWFTHQVKDGQNTLNAELTANIDLSGTCGDGIGNWMPISHSDGYKGHFNGQGHTISNLYMSGDDQYIGLFGYVKGATIENVSVTGIVSSTFSSFDDLDNYVFLNGEAGGIVAYMYNGTIRNCHVDMTVSGGFNIGGICGTMNDGRIEGCTVNGNVICNALPDQGSGFNIGGIVGCQYGGTVRGCVNRATASAENSVYFGGIAGLAAGNAIENCLNYGTFHAVYDSTSAGGTTAGGIVGSSMTVIRGCGNLGSINISGAGEWTGGIVGLHQTGYEEGIVDNCYSVGSITSSDGKYGFIVGVLGTDAIATNCYYLSDTTTEDGGRTAEAFASGQVAYELNGSTTAETNVWRQTIGTDAYPVFTGALVYYGDTFLCDGSSTGIFYHNQAPDTSVPPHTINRDTGLCTVCQTRIGCLRVTTGETDQYAMTLPEAAALAGTETATITLLADLGTTGAPTAAFGSIACGSLLTFDLNGKTVTYSGDSFVTVTAGKLIVTGSGTIQNAAGNNVNFKTVSSGNVKLRGGTYTDGITSSYQYIRDLLDEGYLFRSSTGGWFDCTITASSITNNNFSVQPSPVEIIRIPSDTTIYRGEPVNLTIFATPRLEGTISYEWKYNNGNTTVNGSIFDLSTLTEYKTYEVTCSVKFKTTVVYQKTVRVTVEKCPHENAPNGFCSFCGSYVPAELVDGVYQIANGGNLFWFAAMVNGDSTHADFENQNTGANALLTADIDLENRQWAPIHNYTGTFDGGGHAISNFAITEYNLDTLVVTEYNADNTPLYRMYVGFFGYIENPAVVKNFTINGRIDLTTSGPAHDGYLGSAVAASGQDNQSNGGTIDRITSNVAINIGTDCILSHGGGIAGALYGGTISRCIFDGNGSLSSGGKFNEVGGVVGYCQDTTIENCAFYGIVNVTGANHAGGILGYVNNAGAIIRNNLCNGDVTGGNDQYTGAIIGRVKQNCGEVENNYFESAVMGIDNAFGSGSGFTFTTTAAYDISLDALLSGEVTWQLNGSKDNGVWTQTIGGSSHLPSFDQAPVYRWEPDEVGGAYTYANTPKPAGALSLDITWGDLSFTYTKGTWDPSTHTYSGEGWIPDETGGNCIAVTNNGDLETSVSIRYDAAQGYEAITGTLSETTAALSVGAEKKFWLTLTGKPASELADVTIGAITLTIGVCK